MDGAGIKGLIKKVSLVVCLSLFLAFFLAAPSFAQEQQFMVLEERVKNLEDYVSNFQPAMVEFSKNMENSLQDYTQNLVKSLESYSMRLQQDLDSRIKGIDSKRVTLDPYANDYQKIETNSGVFFIAVQKVEAIEGGMRLYLQIGNPNYADFKDFKLKFFWGDRWDRQGVMPYEQWRESLTGTEFSMQGTLQKGKWNEVQVDLVPAYSNHFNYIECEMSIASIELSY